MKNQFVKRLLAFILTSMMFSVVTFAQIVYTDVNPDISQISSGNTTNYKYYYLDLNNDGINDFTLSASTSMCSPYSTRSVSISASNANKLADSLLFPSRMSLNYPISSNNILWGTYGTLKRIVLCQGSNGGYWSGAGYVGLRVAVGGNNYYGWAHLYVSVVMGTSARFTIYDYAYNSIPNQPILAGETSCTTPTVTLSASGSLSFCAGDSVTLTANGTGYLYQWKKGGVNISGATKQTYVAKTAGVYKCNVANSCGSITSGGKTVTVPCRTADASSVGISGDELEHILVYPNPATNSVTLKFPPHNYRDDETGKILIVNLFGQIVLCEKINADEKAFDVSKFSAGMYVVRWSNGENNETKTFSIIK